MKHNTVQMNCYFGGMEEFFMHFRFQHAYISLILFPVLQLCAVPIFISEDISNLFSLAVANIKTRLTDFEHQTFI
jgi:hypothetical protein